MMQSCLLQLCLVKNEEKLKVDSAVVVSVVVVAAEVVVVVFAFQRVDVSVASS